MQVSNPDQCFTQVQTVVARVNYQNCGMLASFHRRQRECPAHGFYEEDSYRIPMSAMGTHLAFRLFLYICDSYDIKMYSLIRVSTFIRL